MKTIKDKTYPIINPDLKIFECLNSLKKLYRQGWLFSGIEPNKCESVADHSYSLTMLCLLYAKQYPKKLDLEKLLKMALIHDLAESKIGDIIPDENIDNSEKFQKEFHEIKLILAKYPELIVIWEEFEETLSPEALFVKQMDKIEMILQALSYQKENHLDLKCFFESTENLMIDDFFKSLRLQIIAEI